MVLKKSDLPFGSEFSPSQINLSELLQLVIDSMGDWKVFEDYIRIKYFDSNTTNDYNKRKLANNCKLGMIAYGIIDRDANLTEFGKKLYDIKHNETKLEEFISHPVVNIQA